MEPKDKFGRQLYGKVWSQLCENGAKLKQAGYWECTKKPNLFMKKEGDFSLYADMRGTEEVPIWDDTRPLFYAYPKDRKEAGKHQTEAIRQIIASEIYRLHSIGIDVRLSFCAECEPNGQNFGVYYRCVNCDEPFGHVSQKSYCDKCMAQYETERLAKDIRESAVGLNRAGKCSICGQRILNKGEIVGIKQNLGKEVEIREGEVHHMHYIPERTIYVCRQCHSKIHHSTDPFYCQFRAEMPRRDFERIRGERTKEKLREWRQNKMWNQRVEERNTKAAQSERWEKMKKIYDRRARRRTGY